MGPFATATEFCEWTGMALPSDLSRLQALLSSASAMIRGETGQVLSQVTGESVIFLPAVAAFSLFLPEAPVTAITSITEATSGLLASTKYTFSRTGQVIRTDGKAWLEVTTVVYTHGYAETSEEFKRIRAVCMQMVKRAFTADESGQALSQGGIPIETVGFPMALFLTDGERDLLPGGTVAVG